MCGIQQRIAQIVGVSSSWIPFLKEGADQLAAQQKAAVDLGLVIDQSTIDKASQFNDQWKTAVVTWDLQFKASLAVIMPQLAQAAGYATSILNAIAAPGIPSVVGLHPYQQSKKQLTDSIDDVQRLLHMTDKLNGDISQNRFGGFQARRGGVRNTVWADAQLAACRTPDLDLADSVERVLPPGVVTPAPASYSLLSCKRSASSSSRQF